MKTNYNVQDVFLNQARKNKIPLTVYMINGFQIKKAVVLSYDSFVVLIEAEGKQMLIYKHAVSTITPEREVRINKGEEQDTDEEN